MKLFNNVLTLGKNPEEWKVGNIILALKRPPGSDIANRSIYCLKTTNQDRGGTAVGIGGEFRNFGRSAK